MARVRAWLVRLLVGALLLVAGVVSIGVAVSYGWQRERVRDALAQALARALDAEVELDALRGTLHRAPVLAGLRIRVHGAPLLEAERIRLEIGDVELRPHPHLTLDLVEVEGATLHLSRAKDGSWNVEALGGGATGEAEASPGPEVGPPLSVTLGRVELRGGRLLADPLPEREDDAFAARIEGSLDSITLPPAEGLLDALRADLRAELEAMPGAPVEGHLSARLEEGRVALVGELRVDQLARLVPGTVGLSGAASLVLEAGGPLLEPTGTLALSGRDLVLHGEPLGHLELRVAGDPEGVLRLERLFLEGGRLPLRSSPGARIEASAQGVALSGLRIESGAQWLELDGALVGGQLENVRLRAGSLDVPLLAELARAPFALSGRADLDLTLGGSLEAPSLDGALDWGDASFEGVRLERLLAHARARAERVDLELRLPGAGATPRLRLEAVLPRSLAGAPLARLLASPRTEIRLETSALALEPFASLLAPHASALAGTLDAQLALRGGAPEPSLEGELSLEKGRLHVARLDRTFAPLDARLTLDGDRVRIDELVLQDPAIGSVHASGALRVLGLRARLLGERPPARLVFEGLVVESGPQQIALEGTLGLDRFEGLRLEARDLDARALGALAGTPVELGGTIDARLALDGVPDRPEVEGTLDWLRPLVGEAHAERIALRVETEASRLRGEGAVTVAGRELLDVRLFLPREIAPPQALLASPASELVVEARGVDLAFFEPLLPSALREPRGRLQGRLELRGGQAVAGALDLADASLSVPLLGRTFAPIQGSARLDGETLHIASLEVGPPGSRASLVGSVQLAGMRPEEADLHLVLEDFALSRTSILHADASGEVDLHGPLEAPTIDGELALDDVAVTLPEASDPTLKEIRVIAADGAANGSLHEAGRGPSPFQRAGLDLRLKLPPGSWVRGRGAELDLEGGLAVRKAPREDPSWSGAVQVVRGSYRLHGKTFQVRRGEATLDGASRLDPWLDIVAAHRVRDVTVLALIGGRASNPVIRLGSEPSLPDADVLAYLLFGRPAAELGAGSSQGLQSAAAQAASGLAASQLSQVLQEVLPVDTLDVRIQEGGASQLGVGKYLGERVFVRYGKTLGSDPEDEVSVELRLSDQWSLESEITSSGSAGADLVWSFDY